MQIICSPPPPPPPPHTHTPPDLTCPKILTRPFGFLVICKKVVTKWQNSVQFIWVYTACSGMSVVIFWVQKSQNFQLYSILFWPKFYFLCHCFLTLKMPRKPASENVIRLCCLLNILANFSNLFLHTGKQCGPRSD